MAARLRLVSLVLASVASLVGCSGLSKEYTWTRQEPAIGRRSPTTFTVRLTTHPGEGKVVWFLTAKDADGAIGNGTFETWTDCTFLDDGNWECAPILGEDAALLVQVAMRDGKLYQYYWGEERHFQTRHRIFGRSMSTANR